MIDGIDLEAIPVWLSGIESGAPVYRRVVQVLDDYLKEFPKGPFSSRIEQAKKVLVVKEDEPLPTPEEAAEILEKAEAEAKAAKKSKRSKKV